MCVFELVVTNLEGEDEEDVDEDVAFALELEDVEVGALVELALVAVVLALLLEADVFAGIAAAAVVALSGKAPLGDAGAQKTAGV